MRLTQNSSRKPAGQERRDVIRGAEEQVIRVRVPVPGIIREAVFFLHEDYLRRTDMSREELLCQARRSAEDYLCPCLPQKVTAPRWPYAVLFLIGAALGLGLGVMLRL